jgi:two-component system NtrC family response regulator
MDGMELLRRLRPDDADEAASQIPVIVLTAHGSVEQAVAAMKLGAFTYLLKPFERDELLLTVRQALRTAALEKDNRTLRRLLRDRTRRTEIVHRSRAMARVLAQIERVAPSDATLLVTGESGTGKELIARSCHDLSPRWDRPFVAVNCAAIPAELMESELFGHERGAFTGADRARPGRIRTADQGTLFLDEVAELPLTLQPKLLRVLEAGHVDPVGGTVPVPVDFRLICATNRNLTEFVASGGFRQDLYYRLAVMPVHVPPLRERPEDISPLWDHFTRHHSGVEIRSAPDLMERLAEHDWPGNVRELRNLNERLLLLRRGDELTLDDLNEATAWSGESNALVGRSRVTESPARETASDRPRLPLGPLPEKGFSLPQLEREVIRRALERHGGNKSRTALYLGIPRHVLVYRIGKYEL